MRANRVLVVALQAQGLSDYAGYFAYRAQALQRQLLLLLAMITSSDALHASMGGLVLFALDYFLSGGVAGQANLTLQQQALDALRVSLNAVHGRVFFTQLGLDTMQSWLEALESIIGIVIEGVFVAMLIQRFFGR